MNIMKIEIDATTKEDYCEIWDLMRDNAPCIAFIKVKMYNDTYRDGHVTQYFMGVADGKEYYTVSCGKYLYDLGIKAMYSDDEPVLKADTRTDHIGN